MDEVTVNKADLLAKLTENRKNHVQLYNDALEGFFIETKKKLDKALAKVKKQEVVSSVSIHAPVDHTEEYDQAISLLEMSVDDEITLRRNEFNNYVLDHWISQSEKRMLRAMALSSSNASTYQI